MGLPKPASPTVSWVIINYLPGRCSNYQPSDVKRNTRRWVRRVLRLCVPLWELAPSHEAPTLSPPPLAWLAGRPGGGAGDAAGGREGGEAGGGCDGHAPSVPGYPGGPLRRQGLARPQRAHHPAVQAALPAQTGALREQHPPALPCQQSRQCQMGFHALKVWDIRDQLFKLLWT